MLVRRWCCALATLLCAAVICSQAQAQVSGRITGTVVDPSGSIVVGASITLVNERTGDVRTTESNDTGSFVFPNVPPSSYSVLVQAKGFTTLERTNLILSANQSQALGNLQLAVGELTDTVTVAATGAAVELDTSGQNQVITAQQLGGLMSRGRDIVSLITVLPGVSQNASSDSVGGNWGTGTPNMQGLRSHWNTFQLDGQPGNDIDVLNFFTMSVSMDAVEEVSVKSNSYLAEEGRLPGANVNIVSKSGSQEFRGSGYYFKRHEQFNANNFFNNRLGIPKPLTRYGTFGATLGGPAYIPGTFNRNRDKLFFFVSREDWRIKLPGPILQATLPTELERRGDFSQSVDQNGQLIQVIDPTTGMPVPGNIIPANRIHPMGRNLLALLPQPNLLDTSITRGAFNYRDQEIVNQPKAQTQLKVDWMPTTRDRISFRPRWWTSDRQGQFQSTAFNANFLFQQHHYEYVTNAYAGSYTRIFSPSVVNEFNIGYSEAKELGTLNDEFQLADVRRERHGLERLGQLFPSANPLNLIPRMSFGGLPSAPNVDFDPRTPIAAGDERVWMTNNLTWVIGSHNLKFGVYYELNKASEGPRADAAGRHMGTFNFDRDGNNPFDSNHPFANAMLGNFRQYSESSGLSGGRAQIYTVEWFAQDSWKVTPRLTLDYGARFYSFTPWRLRFDEGAAFAVSRYDAANVPKLYFPARNAAGNRVAMNPNTGELGSAVLIGAFAPGPGDRFTGIVVGGDESYPDGFRERPPVQIGPRAGFAYDLFGNGKTAVRGGFGVHKQTIFSSQASMWTTTTAPPILESPTIFYGNLDSFLGASQVFFPTDYQSFDRDFDKVPTTYRWSFGIQQDIGFGTVADITYVGSEGRNLRQSKNINTLAPGVRFLPSSQDPTTGRPLPDNFLRFHPGFQNLSFQEESGFSNYHALQVGINRRYTAGLQLGVAYTWSKAMGISDQDNGSVPLYRDVRSYLYGKLGYDQTHVLVFNYLWSLPNAKLFAGNRATRLLFHDWEVAGITAFASGTPLGINLSRTDGVDRHGGGDPPRVNVIADPTLSGSERSFERWFNTDAFAAPGVGDFGNAPRDVFRGPGINNSDLALLKYFPLRGRARFQFRWEIYNLFNHPQWAGVDNNARFDAAGRQVNGQFGQITSARDARQMQFSLRVEF